MTAPETTTASPTHAKHSPSEVGCAEAAYDSAGSGNHRLRDPLDNDDVLPLSHRAKFTMLVQSTISLALFGLVVARAVNVFK
jgi:hypothetical protein